MDGYERRQRNDAQPFTVGYFARVAPEKGLHVLAEAYRELRRRLPDTPFRLEAAGYLGAEHKPYLDGIQRQLAEWGLDGEFRYVGEVDREGKIGFLQGLDILSVPGDYADPKGIYLLEAMACGVPFVQPAHGAFPELKQRTQGGLLTTPGDPLSVAAALATVAENRELRETLARNAYENVRRHFGVKGMAESAIEAYSHAAQAARSAVPV